MAKKMVKENINIQMEVFIKGNGWMEWNMDKVSINFLMEAVMKVSGKTINNMEKEFLLNKEYINKEFGKKGNW